MHLDVSQHRVDGGLVRIAPSGEVDLETADRLRQGIVDAIEKGHVAEVVVDLEQVTFLDSTGIAALLAGHNAAMAHATGYRVVNAREMVCKALDVSGVLATLTSAENPNWPRG